MARRGQQPRLRVLRHAVAGPTRECRHQCVAEGVLSAGNIAGVRREVRHQTAVRLASYPLDRAMSGLLATFTHFSTCLMPKRMTDGKRSIRQTLGNMQ